jgi:hypothetical protein
LGGVDMRDLTQSYFGYSVPCFYRDAQYGTVLFCGGELGEVAYYKQIDGNLDGSFERAEANLAETVNGDAKEFREGRRAAVAVADLTGDGKPELILGNYAGGAAFFRGAVPPAHNAVAPRALTTLRVYPNPAGNTLHVECDEPVNQIVVYDLYGRVVLVVNDIGEEKTTIDTKELASGVYFVRLANHAVAKFLKTDR